MHANYLAAITGLLTCITLANAQAPTPGAVVKLCYAKDLGSKCTNRQSDYGVCQDFGDNKYADRGSSFGVSSSQLNCVLANSSQIDDLSQCRLFNKPASDGCKDPSKEEEGNTGRDERRTTPWIAAPGKMEFVTPVQWRSFKCESLFHDMGNPVTAFCSEEHFCNPAGGAGWD